MRNQITQKIKRVIFEEVAFSFDQITDIMEWLSVNRSRSVKLNMGIKNFTVTVKRHDDTTGEEVWN